jgi:hypothetical protein
VDIGQSIIKAIGTFNSFGNWQVEGWEQNDISGLPLVAPIFSKISEAAFLAADIIYLSENVAFETGTTFAGVIKVRHQLSKLTAGANPPLKSARYYVRAITGLEPGVGEVKIRAYRPKKMTARKVLR